MALVGLTLIFLSCGSTKHSRLEIMSVLEAQEKAWSKGDIGGFMEGYWRSDSITFVGSRGLSYGYDTVLRNYKAGYPDRQSMGELNFDILSFKMLGRKNAFMIGQYHLKRQSMDDATGFFTIIWEKVDGEWVIISDQSN